MMSWYYADNGKQVGPTTDDEFTSLLASGKITPETMVWREGMAAWQPYRTAAAGDGATTASGIPAAAGATGLVTCSYCQQSFPADEVITVNGRTVCASCKPLAVQLVKEGVDVPGELNYASFGTRFAAKFLDGIILWIVNFGIGTVFGVALGGGQEAGAGKIAATLLMVGLQLGVQLAYSVFFVGKMGGTPGKLACGLRIVRPDGTPLTYGRAVGRFFAEWVTACTFTIGYIIAAFDDQRRSLHDRIADTRVIKK